MMKSKKNKKVASVARAHYRSGSMPIGKKRVPATPEFAETTMQLPIGVGSGIDALESLELTTAEYAVLAFHISQSHWDSGLTRWTSTRRVAKSLGMSKSYVAACEKRLISLGYLEMFKKNPVRGKRYKINPHIAIANDATELPTDAEGKPLKMAVPFGIGSVFARLTAGDIKWKDMVVWLVLRRRSHWKTGKTDAIGLRLLARLCRIALRTLRACLKRLKAAGLAKRISASNVRSVFQLYPKLPDNQPSVKAQKKQSTGGCTIDGDYWVSRNKRVRQSKKTNELEMRVGRKWVKVRDKDRNAIPAVILRDLQSAVDISALCDSAIGRKPLFFGEPQSGHR